MDYQSCTAHCNFDHLPEGLEAKYRHYEPDNRQHLIPRDFLARLATQYRIPETTLEWLIQGLEAVEADKMLFHFTKFLVHEMCLARNRCDEVSYTSMTPGCMKPYSELYSFLLLLACVAPSVDMLKRRGVPETYYEQIPHQPLKNQIEKLVRHGDPAVHDFPWVMNFYTCSIFRLERFLFIPHRFSDEFTFYRNRKTYEAAALSHPGLEFRSDGQRNGVNGVHDPEGLFTTEWMEDAQEITAHRINPMGFVERERITLSKQEWEPALKQGDLMLALHIPSGPGYTPERLKASMRMAIEFYATYFPELPVKGFWSESWLYDPRLSLVLDPEKSHIVQVQRQLYNYPIPEGDGMLRHEVFGDRNADPAGSPGEFNTSLQRAAAEYMKTGARYHTTSMIVLKDEVGKIGSMPYIAADDIDKFRRTVDSHIRRGKPNV